MKTNSPLVRIDALSKQYGASMAVDNVSLDIADGEFISFLGPSGSGKTTTLSIMAGFTEQTAGEIYVDGYPLTKVPPHKRNIGMVFQRYTLFPHMSVFDNVAFPLSVRGVDRQAIKTAVDDALKMVRLENLASRRPAQLSGGQQQRVALARALVYKPRILLMDEPLSALDKKLREEIQTELRRLHSELAVTIIYVTHDQEEALRLSDRIAIFNQGRIVQVGTGEDLYKRPASEFVASFIGGSNFLDGKVVSAQQGRVRVDLGGGALIDVAQNADEAAQDGRIKLMVRPEAIRLLSAQDGQQGENVIAGRVVDRSYLGDILHYDIQTASGKVSARLAAAHHGSDMSRFDPGSDVLMQLPIDEIHMFPSA
ncbi:ABC transporter ATP-binding protein [Rhizobium sp. 2MFCol3.1]|uniref:ABC transporter ATP-binding protein n=1 Tax=Rhizobium sp. 2MFCol3.1 TaxID=1246459 RepID=UPI000362C045|nr:ABC transporter ATP-binding protein [Rhizobium sp. 2MFCol3.1]